LIRFPAGGKDIGQGKREGDEEEGSAREDRSVRLLASRIKFGVV